ncbi:MAG: hypothetical protein AAF806_20555 [Bacteroidota bacterium]
MRTILCALFHLTLISTFAQVNYTANDKVIPSEEAFGSGVNIGYYNGWTLLQLSDIAVGNPNFNQKGLGINTTRQSLPEHFQEQWGYDFRLGAFKHFEQYGGQLQHTIFVGYPSEAHRDTEVYCNEQDRNFDEKKANNNRDYQQSILFKNMYEPIWDNGENGTPYNDENYYAAYLYKTVTLYKSYVKYWEILNEPDQTASRYSNYAAGRAGNWWENNPSPCECAIKAPIFHYIRMLRISWEIIKTVDPTAYVAIGGIGYPSFLDAVLRNTDNPNDGSTSKDFPLKGGAYFDVLSYHSYPHLDSSLKKWNNSKKGFDYFRHTDAAVKGVFALKDRFQTVLDKHGYDDKQFPEKEWIITECNVPKVTINGGFGSGEVQRNFIVKVMIEARKQGLRQFQVYNLGDKMTFQEATTPYAEFNLMGMFKNMYPEDFSKIYGDMPTNQHNHRITELGTAYRTINNALKGFSLDEKATAALANFAGIDGGVFKNGNGERLLVIWAKTSSDKSEKAQAELDLATFFKGKKLEKYTWNYSQTNKMTALKGTKVSLTGSPMFIKVK